MGKVELFEAKGSGRRAPEVRVSLEKMFDRPPPHSPEAEMALLGAMILDPRIAGDVVQIVKKAEEFYLERHGAIFQALVEMYDKHQSGDLPHLVSVLQDRDELKDVGGAAYLEKLAAETPGTAGAPRWARIVSEKARLRRLIDTAGGIVFDAYNMGQGSEGAAEIIDRAEQQIFDIAQQEETADARRLADLLQEEFQRLVDLEGGAVTGVSTGYPDLDKLTSGFQNGDMIVLAARPSMGKTALALNLAEQIALGGAPHSAKPERRAPVGFFSMEMSHSSVAMRILSARSGIPSDRMRSGRLSEDDYGGLERACDELSEAEIYIDDTPGLTVLSLRARARRMVSQHGVRAIFVDYLQLMSAPGSARESRQVEVSAISRGIKALARELNVPVVCLSQLNRGPESREHNRPRMSDLRESGSIEQDADVVMLLHREEYYHKGQRGWAEENEDKVGVAELIIAKQRNGPTDTVWLKWDEDTTRFRPLERHSRGGYADDDYWDGGVADGGSPPWTVPVQAFRPGEKTGPVADFRDGGGPDRDEPEGSGGGFDPGFDPEEEGDEPPI